MEDRRQPDLTSDAAGEFRSEPSLSLVRRLQPSDPAFDDERFDPFSGMPPLVRALRPLQWTKNLLVFAALIFARDTFQVEPVAQSICAFIAFCAMSSSIYLINDVRDRDLDKLHPVKRSRPIAAGTLSPRTAIRLSGALTITSLTIGYLSRPELMLVLLLYLALMIGYNVGLKQVVILDVIIIALGFVLRAAGGAVAIDVPISPWLYVCTLVVALLVGFGKRRNELLALHDNASQHRPNLETYTIGMLDQSIAIAAAATLVAYSVYTFESEALPESHAMMLTIPIVTYAVFRYLYLVYMKRAGGSPEVMLVRDRPLQLSVVLWVAASIAILYWS